MDGLGRGVSDDAGDGAGVGGCAGRSNRIPEERENLNPTAIDTEYGINVLCGREDLVPIPGEIWPVGGGAG